MAKEIYLIRHGRTEYNRLGIWQGSGVDSSLDEMGKEEAQKFYKHYVNEGFDLVIHSSLKRSKETISYFVKDGMKTWETPLINEISWGHFEGKPHTEESLATYRSVVSSWKEHHYHVGFPGGESAFDLSSRLSKFLEKLSNRKEKKILICSHGRAIRGLLCLMREEPMSEMEKYEHANTGLFKAKMEKQRFLIEKLNNTDHL